MESPVKFNVWGVINASRREEALSTIRKQGIHRSEIELRKAVSRAVQNNRTLQISAAIGYQSAKEFVRRIDDVFMGLTYCQEGHAPSLDKRLFCEKHNFHFGGCLGCHLCSGFYQR